MSVPTHKLAAILAADIAGYWVPVMLVMGQVPTESTPIPIARTQRHS